MAGVIRRAGGGFLEIEVPDTGEDWLRTGNVIDGRAVILSR